MKNKKRRLMRSVISLCIAVFLLTGLFVGMGSNNSVKSNSYATSAKKTEVIQDSQNGEPIPGEYIVKKKNGDVELVKSSKGIEALKADGDIVAVEQNRIVSAFDLQPSGNAASLDGSQIKEMQYGDEMVRAPEAWDMLPKDTATVRVAVIDTGIDATHPDLAGKVIEGTTIIETTSSGKKYADDGKDDHGHGTHVSGIIAATWNNGMGIDGVTGNVDIELMPVKVLNDAGRGSTYDIINGIRYAADHGASILNLSLGSNASSSLEAEAVRYAQNKGCLVIAAAGNDSIDVSFSWPASYDGVISVGSVDSQEERSYFSNYGSTLDVAAPGSDIISTVPKATALQEQAQGYAVYGNDDEGYYISWSGTSMATPHAAGVAALYKAANPGATGADIGDLMINTAKDVGEIGKDIETGAGIVDAAAMLGAEMVKTPVKIKSPKAKSELYEEVLLSAQVNPTMDIKKLKFYLDKETDDNLIGEADCNEENSFYEMTWNTKDSADGDHKILAAVYDSKGVQVGESESIQVSILNNITNGFTLQVMDPKGEKTDRASYYIYGKKQDDTYKLVKSGTTSELGYSRVKGLSDTYTEFKMAITGKYTAEAGNGYYVYTQDFSQEDLGGKLIISGNSANARKVTCVTKNADGQQFDKYYLRLGFANGAGWAADMSPVTMNSDTELYLSDGTYRAEAYQSKDSGGKAYLLNAVWDISAMNAFAEITADSAARITADYNDGVGGNLEIEGSRPQDEIRFMSGTLSGSELYVSPSGEYEASADLTAQQEGANWAITIRKKDNIKIEDSSNIRLDFKPDIKVESFKLTKTKNDDDGAYIYTGEALTSENGFGDVQGDIIEQAAQTYPTFRIYKMIDGKRSLVYEKTDRGNSSSSYWNSRTDYNGNVPPTAGEYVAQLIYDAGPFGGQSVKEENFRIKTRSGSEEMSSTIHMDDGKYKMARARMSIYTWDGSSWQQANAAAIKEADEDGVIRNINMDNISLANTGINAALITFNGRKEGYQLPFDYTGFAVVPFRTLDELQEINFTSDELQPVRSEVFDQYGNKRAGNIYLPVLSDGGKLAEAKFVTDVKLPVASNNLTTLYIPKGTYQYVYSSFADGNSAYFLKGAQFNTAETERIQLKGAETKKVDLKLPQEYKNLKVMPKLQSGEGLKISMAAGSSLYMTPDKYDMELQFTSSDENYRYTVARNQVLDMSEDREWNVTADFAGSINLKQSKVAEDQTLLGDLSFKDSEGNRLTRVEVYNEGFYGDTYPSINVGAEGLGRQTFSLQKEDGYHSFAIDPEYYYGEGPHYVSVSYDLGQGLRESSKTDFIVGLNYNPELSPETGDGFEVKQISEGVMEVTAGSRTKGYLPVTVKLNTSSRERDITFEQYRDGKKIQEVKVKSIFASKDDNTLSASFNIKPGDVIKVNAK